MDESHNDYYVMFERGDPETLIPELCRQFYSLGWVSGTGGGLSIRQDGIIYCAPSGVQKERIKPEDLFLLYDTKPLSKIVKRPENPRLKVSECLYLFNCAFDMRDAKCCIHNHSIYANLVTALCKHESQVQQQQDDGPIIVDDTNGSNTNVKSKTKIVTKNANEFRISHQEMIKGIYKGSTNETYKYNETLIVPIINNVLYERDLVNAMTQAINDYPLTNAILVRNHGCYVWGPTWQKAKSMAECYDYLFKLKVEASKLGIDI